MGVRNIFKRKALDSDLPCNCNGPLTHVSCSTNSEAPRSAVPGQSSAIEHFSPTSSDLTSDADSVVISAAMTKTEEDGVDWWKAVVGIDMERALDTRLFRVLEWGGMEVLQG
jgi:hypothetical protein